MKIYITGIGVVSAIGNNVEENYTSLTQQKTGIKKHAFPTINKAFHAGLVSLSNKELAMRCGYSDANVSRTSLLGLLAAKECWGKNQNIDGLRTGLISGTSVGGMDKSEVYFEDRIHKGNGDISVLKYHDSGSTTEKIADHIGIKDYINTLSTACSSGSNSVLCGARLIKYGKLDRVMVGGSDAITNFTLCGFNSLMVYSDEWCQPFDENRKGLNLGEGAAYLMLESEESIRKTKNKPLAVVSGWANTADAFHQTATSPNGYGAALAMNKALEIAQLKASEIDYINAHGTCTPNNDLTESKAMQTVFNATVPDFSSTKSYTGHTLAASGAIESVYAVLAFQNKVIFPNLNYKAAIEETGLIPVLDVVKKDRIQHIMNNSFGFGGNCTSLILSAE